MGKKDSTRGLIADAEALVSRQRKKQNTVDKLVSEADSLTKGDDRQGEFTRDLIAQSENLLRKRQGGSRSRIVLWIVLIGAAVALATLVLLY